MTVPECIARNDPGALVQALVAGERLDTVDDEGNTLLHRVVLLRAVECLSVLLEESLDINAKNSAGNTILHVACEMQQNYRGNFWGRNLECLRLILKSPQVDVNAKNVEGNT